MNTLSHRYQETLQQLRECYDTHAEKFSSTRKKHRPEFERIAQKIENNTWWTIHDKDQITKSPNHQHTILELWCGDGRLYPYLKDHGISIGSYTGVDISQQLLLRAEQHSPSTKKTQRILDDMLHYLESCPSESVDYVICVASFQHIPDRITRDRVLRQIYRVLRYGWSLISIDRSRSRRMLQTHRKAVLKSGRRFLQSGMQEERNNLMIPFTSNKQKAIRKKSISDNQIANLPARQLTNHRLYHIFTRPELDLLLRTHGFVIEEMIYSSQSGEFHRKRTQARNICTIVRKDVFVN